MLRDVLGRALDRGAVRDVHAVRADLFASVLGGDVEDGDTRTPIGEAACDLSPELPRAAGDDGDPPVEREEVGGHAR